VDNVKTLFTSLYREEFTKPLTSVIECPFDEYFNRQIQELEKQDAGITTRQTEQASDAMPSAQKVEDQAGLMAPPPMPMLRRSMIQPKSYGSSMAN